MRMIATTMQPDTYIVVEDTEYNQLQAQGLVASQITYDGPAPRPLIEREQ
jgi:hypothetical protein